MSQNHQNSENSENRSRRTKRGNINRKNQRMLLRGVGSAAFKPSLMSAAVTVIGWGVEHFSGVPAQTHGWHRAGVWRAIAEVAGHENAETVFRAFECASEALADYAPKSRLQAAHVDAAKVVVEGVRMIAEEHTPYEMRQMPGDAPRFAFVRGPVEAVQVGHGAIADFVETHGESRVFAAPMSFVAGYVPAGGRTCEGQAWDVRLRGAGLAELVSGVQRVVKTLQSTRYEYEYDVPRSLGNDAAARAGLLPVTGAVAAGLVGANDGDGFDLVQLINRADDIARTGSPAVATLARELMVRVARVMEGLGGRFRLMPFGERVLFVEEGADVASLLSSREPFVRVAQGAIIGRYAAIAGPGDGRITLGRGSYFDTMADAGLWLQEGATASGSGRAGGIVGPGAKVESSQLPAGVRVGAWTLVQDSEVHANIGRDCTITDSLIEAEVKAGSTIASSRVAEGAVMGFDLGVRDADVKDGARLDDGAEVAGTTVSEAVTHGLSGSDPAPDWRAREEEFHGPTVNVTAAEAPVREPAVEVQPAAA